MVCLFSASTDTTLEGIGEFADIVITTGSKPILFPAKGARKGSAELRNVFQMILQQLALRMCIRWAVCEIRVEVRHMLPPFSHSNPQSLHFTSAILLHK